MIETVTVTETAKTNRSHRQSHPQSRPKNFRPIGRKLVILDRM